MSREDVHKLLGGYATGTLTPEEQQALFEAALQDQDLFDALAREQTLRETLSDPAARAHLLAALDDAPVPWYRRLWRPLPMSAISAAMAAIWIFAVWQGSRTPKTLKLAKLDLPAAHRVEEAPPVLPPPPPLERSTRQALAPLSLPAGVAPVVPPPPAPAAAPVAPLAKSESVVTGSLGAIGGDLKDNALDRIQNLPIPAQPLGRNAFLGNGFVRGTVTDPAGAPIRSATVEVKSLATGEVKKTSTDERGAFSATEISGREYEISAQAPGFRPSKVQNLMPPVGSPEPVNLRLDVGVASETVQVAAADTQRAVGGAVAVGGGGRGGGGGVRQQSAAGQQQGQQGQQGQSAPMLQSQSQSVFGANSAAAPAAPLPPLQYRAMRRMPDGSLQEVGSNGNVAVGATIVLQVTPNSSGILRVSRGGSQIVSLPLTAFMQSDIPLRVKFSKKERVDLNLVFSSEALEAKQFAPTSAVTSAKRSEPAKEKAAPAFQATLTLNFQ